LQISPLNWKQGTAALANKKKQEKFDQIGVYRYNIIIPNGVRIRHNQYKSISYSEVDHLKSLKTYRDPYLGQDLPMHVDKSSNPSRDQAL
jgi:hypothetical protein